MEATKINAGARITKMGVEALKELGFKCFELVDSKLTFPYRATEEMELNDSDRWQYVDIYNGHTVTAVGECDNW